EATEFNAVAFGKSVGDLVEDRAHDVFDIALKEMRITAGDNLNEFRFDHGFKPLFFCLFHPASAAWCSCARLASVHFRRTLNVPNGEKSVKKDAFFGDLLQHAIGFLRHADKAGTGMNDEIAQ